MSDWCVLLTPLAVLIILAFYRFVGRGELIGLNDPPGSSLSNPPPENTPYFEVVKKADNVLAYWRPGETGGPPPPSIRSGLPPVRTTGRTRQDVSLYSRALEPAEVERHGGSGDGVV